MKTYKLHELVQMAIDGINFRARQINYNGASVEWIESRYIKRDDIKWLNLHILDEWIIEFKPEIVSFELDYRNKPYFIKALYKLFGLSDLYLSLEGKNWHIVATEKVEDK